MWFEVHILCKLLLLVWKRLESKLGSQTFKFPPKLDAVVSLQPVELWTGKQLFSILVRPNANVRVYLNLTLREKNYTKLIANGREIEAMCPNDGFVHFHNSELVSGQLGKATLGQFSTVLSLSSFKRQNLSKI